MKIWHSLVLAGLILTPFGARASPDNTAEVKAQFQRPGPAPHPRFNPFTTAKAKLGKVLFFDPRLSGANAISCADCHNPRLGWEDGLARSFGAAGRPLDRHTPTILNLAWAKQFGWDGRIPTLEGFVLGPIANAKEMDQDLDNLVTELRAVPGYASLFAAAFPGTEINIDHVSLAIATFERTVVSDTAPFDRWIAGDETAIGTSAKKGFGLFIGKAGCAQCHKGWAFTDNAFHDIGLPSLDMGRGGLEDAPQDSKHAFKTPTLRNIVSRAPYMHDGSLDTLETVIDHYADKFKRRRTLAKEIKPLSLSGEDKLNLVAFLHILTEDKKRVLLPEIPQ